MRDYHRANQNQLGGESMSLSRHAHVAVIPALAFVLCVGCTTAMATSIPAEPPAGSDGAFVLFASPPAVADPDSDTTLVASAAGFETGLDVAQDDPSDTKSTRSKGLSTLTYVAGAGAVAGLAVALSNGGSEAIAALLGDSTDRVPANQEEPIPEPTTLVLAALACSSALITLLRRRSTA